MSDSEFLAQIEREPSSILEAREELWRITVERRGIESQLSREGRRGPRAQSMGPKKYDEWRRSAVHALRLKEHRQLFLKQWIWKQRHPS